MAWTDCPHCGSGKTAIKGRELDPGRCECGADDPAHIYGDGDDNFVPECECAPEELEDRYVWSLYCKSCRKWFQAWTELDRY